MVPRVGGPPAAPPWANCRSSCRAASMMGWAWSSSTAVRRRTALRSTSCGGGRGGRGGWQGPPPVSTPRNAPVRRCRGGDGETMGWQHARPSENDLWVPFGLLIRPSSTRVNAESPWRSPSENRRRTTKYNTLLLLLSLMDYFRCSPICTFTANQCSKLLCDCVIYLQLSILVCLAGWGVGCADNELARHDLQRGSVLGHLAAFNIAI